MVVVKMPQPLPYPIRGSILKALVACRHAVRFLVSWRERQEFYSSMRKRDFLWRLSCYLA